MHEIEIDTTPKMLNKIDFGGMQSIEDLQKKNFIMLGEIIREVNKKDWTQKHPILFAISIAAVGGVFRTLATLIVELFRNR